MKKVVSILGSFCFVLLMASCGGNCQDCSCSGGVTFEDADGNEVSEAELCEDDASSKEEFDLGIQFIEALGCECS